MYSTCRLAAAIAVLSLAAPALAGADIPLATLAYTGEGFEPTGGPPSFEPYLLADVNNPGAQNLSGVTMSLVDILQGNVYTLTGDMPYWSGVLSDSLVTGFDMGFFVPGGNGSNTDTTDTAVIASAFSPAPGIGSPDFAPYTVTRVDVRATSFSSFGDGGFEVTIEFSFYGVPAPGAAALLPLGGLASMRRRR